VYPEVITSVHRCKEYTCTYMLLNDTLTVRVHDVRKPVLCLARDWCNKCSVVHVIACMQCSGVYESRRDAVRLSHISTRPVFSTRLFPQRRIKVTTKGSDKNNTRRNNTNHANDGNNITCKVKCIRHFQKASGFCYE
jgi:hypothetical protein